MRLFLDTSVLLAASGSSKGASRFLLREASAYGWELISSDYCQEETRRNLAKLLLDSVFCNLTCFSHRAHRGGTERH